MTPGSGGRKGPAEYSLVHTHHVGAIRTHYWSPQRPNMSEAPILAWGSGACAAVHASWVAPLPGPVLGPPVPLATSLLSAVAGSSSPFPRQWESASSSKGSVSGQANLPLPAQEENVLGEKHRQSSTPVLYQVPRQAICTHCLLTVLEPEP